MTNTRGGYQERLLVELKAVVAGRAADPAPPVPLRRSVFRPRLLVAAAVLAAGVTVALPLLTGTETRAYAVDKHADGTVTATIWRSDDAVGLERQLREAGVAADVVVQPPGRSCAPGRYTPEPGGNRDDLVQYSGAPHRTEVTVDLADFPDGGERTLVLELTEAGPADNRSSAVGFDVALGPVGACELVPGDFTGYTGT